MSRARGSPVCLALALILSACRSGGVADELMGGLREQEVTIRMAARHGPFLEVVVAVPKELSRQYFLPPTPECTAMAVEGAKVVLSPWGSWGRLQRADQICTPSGIGSLRVWRDRGSRAAGRQLPRARAQFQVVFSDQQYAFARGRFPLTSAVGWTRGYDTIAVVPISPECDPPLERGVASIEYQARGTHTFTLISEAGLCPVLGLIIPPTHPEL